MRLLMIRLCLRVLFRPCYIADTRLMSGIEHHMEKPVGREWLQRRDFQRRDFQRHVQGLLSSDRARNHPQSTRQRVSAQAVNRTRTIRHRSSIYLTA